MPRSGLVGVGVGVRVGVFVEVGVEVLVEVFVAVNVGVLVGVGVAHDPKKVQLVLFPESVPLKTVMEGVAAWSLTSASEISKVPAPDQDRCVGEAVGRIRKVFASPQPAAPPRLRAI